MSSPTNTGISGPVTAASIAGQMGGLGSGSAGAPATGYPDPGSNPVAIPPSDSSGTLYYSQTNPFGPNGVVNAQSDQDSRQSVYSRNRFNPSYDVNPGPVSYTPLQ